MDRYLVPKLLLFGYLCMLCYGIGFMIWWEITRPANIQGDSIFLTFFSQVISLNVVLMGLRAEPFTARELWAAMLYAAFGLAGNAYNALRLYRTYDLNMDLLGWILTNVLVLAPGYLSVFTMIWLAFRYREIKRGK